MLGERRQKISTTLETQPRRVGSGRATLALPLGDGAMGFWAAPHEVYGQTRVQRCWIHNTANVLKAMPKSVQSKAKAHLKDICPLGQASMLCR
jgi:transposase-like protein